MPKIRNVIPAIVLEVSLKLPKIAPETSDYGDYKRLQRFLSSLFNRCNLFNNRCNQRALLIFRLFQSSLLFLLLTFNVSEALGYGYGLRGKDTLVAVCEDMTGLLEKNDYAAIQRELEKIEVPLENYHKYYRIGLKPLFLDAIEKHDKEAVIINMEKLIYFAIREKIYWNRKENLEKPVAAKARLKVILQYYELFKPQIKNYDEKNRSAFNREIVELLVGMNKSLGEIGSFGYKAEPANLEEFIRLSQRLEEVLAIIFPHFAEGHKAVIVTH